MLDKTLGYILCCQSPALFLAALALLVAYLAGRKHRVKAFFRLLLCILCAAGAVALYFLGIYKEYFTIRDFFVIRAAGWIGLAIAAFFVLLALVRAFFAAAEQADLAALGIGADQIHHLDAGFKDLRGALLLLIGGCGTVDGPALLGFGGGAVVHRLAQQIENTAKACLAHGNGNGAAGVRGGNAALQAVGAAHGDAANHIVADVLRHLRHQLFPVVLDLNGVEQLRHRIVGKADVQHRAYRLHDGAHVFLCHRIVSFSVIHTAHLPRSP